MSLSFSGSLPILLLLLGRPLLRNRVSKCWQYYIWLVILARLLLPFTPKESPVGTLFQTTAQAIAGTDTVLTPVPSLAHAPLLENGSPVVQNLWLLWLMAALGLLILKITIYQSFVKSIKAGCTEVSDTAILDRLALIGEKARVKKPLELYANSLYFLAAAARLFTAVYRAPLR